MITLARGHSLREAGVFSFESLSTDFVLATLGLAVAAFWHLNPWLIPFAVAPLLLIHRSLAIPQLQAEARVDPKTGLFNARHFASVMQEELGRAQRFQRPMSLIMADLDLLRDINNTYGHLAGDAVLRGIAEVFRQQLRHYDVPARFGGEEFSILLPGDAARAGVRDRRPDPPRRRRAPVRGRDLERADSRHDLDGHRRASRATATTRTSSSTRPTSPSTARSSRAETASSTRRTSRCSRSPTSAARAARVAARRR